MVAVQLEVDDDPENRVTILCNDNSLARSLLEAMGDLPRYPTPFVGRQDELAQIRALLSDPACRLLTLVGPGGIGKTRLAVEAARQQMYPDGVHFVPLQPLASPDYMASAIADALRFHFYPGAEPRQQLLDYFREKSLLLVLDNLEHLLDGVTLLSDILGAAPAVSALATSRERLNLREERVLEVGGLSYPAGEADADIESYSAIELFVQHAERVKAGFRLDDAQRGAVVRICQLVGGMPLGIELAAAWLRALAPRAIAEEIEHSLDILETPARNVEPRHRTMRAAFEPTWDRLSDAERTVFMKLSVFRGGFTREAAEAVAGASLRTLATLVDKSLVRMDVNGRYEIPELLRQYANEQLTASSDQERVQSAHSAFHADFIHRRVKDLKGRRQIEAIAEITADFENVQTAWNHAAALKNADLIEQMIEGLWVFCNLCSRDAENGRLFGFAEQQFAPARAGQGLPIWGRLLARGDDRSDESEFRLETALKIARRCDDSGEIAFCLSQLSSNAAFNGDYARARRLLRQSILYLRPLGDRFYLARALFYLRAHSPEPREATRTRSDESLRLRRAIGDRVGTAWSIYFVAHWEERDGHFQEAERLYLERIAIGYEVGNFGLVALGSAHLSLQVYFIEGNFAKARATAEAVLNMPTAPSYSTAVGWARIALGLLACMDENYREGIRLCQQAASLRGLADLIDNAAWGSAVAACGLGDYDAARESLAQSLRHMIDYRGLTGTIACMPVAAIILAHQGSPARAVELLALAFIHPARAAGWMEKWSLLTRLRSELELVLGCDAYLAAWDRGIALDVDAVVADLRSWFPAKQRTSQDGSSPVYTNLLSDREQEILHLMADGLSNPEIAEQLVLAAGTIKWYVNRIFSKLHVTSRTAAVARARDSGLLP